MADSKKKTKTVDHKIQETKNEIMDRVDKYFSTKENVLKSTIYRDFMTKTQLSNQASSFANEEYTPRLATYAELKKATKTKLRTVLIAAFVVALVLVIGAFFSTTALNNLATHLIVSCDSLSSNLDCKVEHGRILIKFIEPTNPDIFTGSGAIAGAPTTAVLTSPTFTAALNDRQTVVTKLDSSCWFSVEADGKIVLGATYSKGSSKKFKFRHYAEVKDGCPGSLSLDGPVELTQQRIASSSGKTERIELSWKGLE